MLSLALRKPLSTIVPVIAVSPAVSRSIVTAIDEVSSVVRRANAMVVIIGKKKMKKSKEVSPVSSLKQIDLFFQEHSDVSGVILGWGWC